MGQMDRETGSRKNTMETEQWFSGRVTLWPQLVVVLGAATLLGCGGPSRSDLTGTFIRTTPTVSEIIQTRADGTFTQVVNGPDGQV